MEVLDTGKGELFLKPDPNGFRKWVRENKSMALIDKLMTESQAVERFVSDGDYIGMELYGFVRCPMSITREIVRQKKKNLGMAGQGIMEVDLLLAGGLLDRMDITYVGHEVYGISSVLRRAIEGGKVKTVEWSNAALAWRMKAAALGVSFLPVRSMGGSDTFKYSAAKSAKCPFTGEVYTLLPASYLDVGIIHVHRADKYGNCQIDGISGFAYELARASKKLIISAEKIVDNAEIRKYPEHTIIPHFLVDAVVHAPFGSHPGEMCYDYWRDEEHLGEYVAASKKEESMQQYLEKYVYGVSNHDEYMELAGGQTRKALLESQIRGRD